MKTMYACVHYRIEGKEEIVNVWDDMARIGYLENVDCIYKITFYNDAVRHIEELFRNLPYRPTFGVKVLTYTGDMAKFIVYNW